jgi:nucleoside transporter
MSTTQTASPAPLAMTRLGVMMFLEFFLWGSWMVPMGKYLSSIFTGREDLGSIIGNAYGTGSLAAIVAPLFVGLVADRFLPGQVVLGVLHLVGAGLLYGVARASDPATFYWLLLASGLCYMPTLALVNSVSFDHLSEPRRQFPLVRVWGTIGWIAAGITVGSLLPRVLASGGLPGGIAELLQGDASGNDAGKTNLPFLLAAATSAILGVYSFTLPHCPPKAKGQPISVAKLLGLDAVSLLKSPSFAIFALASFLVCIPLAVYYAKANEYISDMGIQKMLGLGSETVMTFGQMSEIGFMLLMPLLLARFGVKTMLIGGMLAWVARYLLFAAGAGSAWMLVLAVVLHGICYDFFFVTGQLYTDHVAPRELRASAQGLIALLTYGAGMFVGNLAFPRVAEALTTEAGVFPWKPFWFTFAAAAAAVMVLFAIAFRDRVKLGSGDHA